MTEAGSKVGYSLTVNSDKTAPQSPRNYCNDWPFLIGFLGVAGFISATGVQGLDDKLNQYEGEPCGFPTP